MATAASIPCISVEEYLRTVYRPDVDFVDGYVEERNLGEFDHGTLQGALAALFYSRRHEWKIRVAPELRVQTSTHRFRIPDVCIMDVNSPKEQIIRHPPILCIEVLSPEDTLRKMLRRVEDYFNMGVPNVWIFDPKLRRVSICHPGGITTEQSTGALVVPSTQIAIDVNEIFGSLDED